MSQENVGIERGEPGSLVASVERIHAPAHDLEAEMFPAREWPENAPTRGAEAIWDFYVEVTSAWEEGSFELGEIIESGTDKIVVNSRREARGRASGAGVAFSYWAVITFRGGKAIRIEWFAERDQALEAAGYRDRRCRRRTWR
jgi:ketosteroid isomerase-like protein